MPTIKRLPKKTDNTGKRGKRQKIYQSRTWKEMRLAKLMKNPLCQICELEGKTTLAQAVHHLDSFVEHEDNEVVMYYLAYNDSNFCSVCNKCHNRCHTGDLKGTKTLEQIKQYIEAHNKENK